jgi:hypothetical protein
MTALRVIWYSHASNFSPLRSVSRRWYARTSTSWAMSSAVAASSTRRWTKRTSRSR